jgi:hypothetical protein
MKTSCIRVLAAALTDMQAAGKGEMKTKVEISFRFSISTLD